MKSFSSLVVLILANLFVIYFAGAENWDTKDVSTVYFCQSIIIGFFNFLRMLTVEEISTAGFRQNNSPVLPTKSNQIFAAIFFLIHYNILLFFFMRFAISKSGFELRPELWIAIMAFFFTHLFSFVVNYPTERRIKKNIGSMMFFPYIRILPMNVVVTAGSTVIASQPQLLGLKTLADTIMHLVEHNVYYPDPEKLKKQELEDTALQELIAKDTAAKAAERQPQAPVPPVVSQPVISQPPQSPKIPGQV